MSTGEVELAYNTRTHTHTHRAQRGHGTVIEYIRLPSYVGDMGKVMGTYTYTQTVSRPEMSIRVTGSGTGVFDSMK
jgi:hypothetical protein